MGSHTFFEGTLKGDNPAGPVSINVDVGTDTFFPDKERIHIEFGKEKLSLPVEEAEPFIRGLVEAAFRLGVEI